jgi:hypothetical protein
MKRSPIRIFLLLGIISMSGALITQIFWLQKALKAKGENFDSIVLLALRRVAEHIDFSSTNTIITLDVVRKLSPRTFQLSMNDRIDCNFLEFYLRTELSYPSLNVDFQYSIHESETDRTVFTREVTSKEQSRLYAISTDLPVFNAGSYYVNIYFPTRSAYIGTKMDDLVIFFFLYSL